MRALVVGPSLPIRNRRGIQISASKSLVNSPSLIDFGIVVLQYSKDRMSRRGLEDKRKELEEFLRAGGYCVVMPLELSMSRTAGMWCPVEIPDLIHLEGTTIKWKKGTLVAPPAEGIKFRTLCIAEIRPGDSATILARNNTGGAVGFSIPVKEGQMLFLPAPENMTGRCKFVKAQIDHISSIVAQAECKPPQWFIETTTSFETRLENQLSRLRTARGSLHATGKPLSRAIHVMLVELLRPLGFTVEYREDQGLEDIRAQSSTREIRFECKGLKGYANVEDLRQLLDHCSRGRPKTKLKGVFVVNHYREEPPVKRGLVATKDAIDLAAANDFLITSTAAVFGAYIDVLEGRMDGERFLKLVLSSTGLVENFSD